MQNEDEVESSERQFMLAALEEAKRSRPEDARVHPMVGVVVVKNGQILAAGHRSEGRHAEYEVLENDLKNEQIAGATVYTTLEPCTERNAPKIACVDRLIARKVDRVVVAMLDPNPRIRGQGIRELENVRIKVDRFHEDIRLSVEELNRDFIREHDEKRRTGGATGSMPTDTADTVENDRERQAMRAFLQRAEVRLSTMHRVAGAFLSGAGLLFLLPVLFRDYPRELATAVVASLAGLGGLGLVAMLLLLLLVVGTLSVSLYSLYLLVKDIGKLCTGLFAVPLGGIAKIAAPGQRNSARHGSRGGAVSAPRTSESAQQRHLSLSGTMNFRTR